MWEAPLILIAIGGVTAGCLYTPDAMAAGQKDMHDGFCMLAGLLLANPTECDTSADNSLCNNVDLADCNCGIDNAASFEGVSDCPDLHARMERVCEKLRACDAPSPTPPSAAPSHPPPSADVSVSAPAPPPWCHRCRTADVGEKGTSVSAATEDAGPGLAIGLALGGCLLVAMLAAAVFVWHRKRHMQPPPSSASNAAPQQVQVVVTQPESKKAAAPDSLSALLAACGLEHHEETFRAEAYTLDTLLSSMKQGEEAVKSDLRELKLTLGECRKLITQLKLQTSK